MPSRTTKQVTFHHPFKLPSVGKKELPAGTYNVIVETTEIRLHGHSMRQSTDHFPVPAGFFKADDLGGYALLSKGELGKALINDRSSPSAIAGATKL